MTLQLGGGGAITGCTSLQEPDLIVSGLTVNGDIDAPKIIVNPGTAAAPSYTFSGDTDNGLYYAGTNSIGLSTAGTNAILIDSSGKVGIGTTSPGQKLSVAGSALLQQDDSFLQFRNTAGTSTGYIQGHSSYLDIQSGSGSSNTVRISTNATERLRINSSGNLGLGTSTFTAASSGRQILEINGTTGALINLDVGGTRKAYYFTDGTDVYNYNTANGNYIFGTNGGERLRIDSSGNVGIGTSSPSVNLDIVVASGTAKQKLGSSSVAGGSYTNYHGASGTKTWFVGSNYNVGGALEFWQSTTNGGTTPGSSPAMLIDSSGRVGVGVTPPNYGSGRNSLDIHSSGSAITHFGITNSTTGSGGVTNGFNIIQNGLDTQLFLRESGFMSFSTASNERMRIDSSGRLLLGTSSHSSLDTFVVEGHATDGTSAAFMMLRRGSANPTGGLGYIRFADSNGSVGAMINSEAVGTWGSNNYPGELRFYTTAGGASSPTERMRIDSSGNAMFGTTNNAVAVQNIDLGTVINGNNSGRIYATADGHHDFNRTADGEIFRFRSATNTEGSISVSGSTVSYNGGHLSRWSQLPGGAVRTEILRGSVLSNLDEMCEWGEEDNEQLNRMKVSDVEGDKNVSGVFQSWDDDDDTYINDFYCAMTGDFVIRIAQGTTVARGDLLMSAGNGTAKPQDDDIIRSKTIAKVTSTNVSETYADGSYCVPCVLMAC